MRPSYDSDSKGITSTQMPVADRIETAMNSGNNSHHSERVSLRVLIIIHGYEPAGSVSEACRLLSMLVNPTIRVLPLLNVPSPPFTSLTRFARRAYHAARDAWKKHEEIRVQEVIDQMMRLLSGRVELAPVVTLKGSLVSAIAEHVTTWSADVVVIARPATGIRSWLWPGPVHRRLLRYATCAVMITPAAVTPRAAIGRTVAPYSGMTICPPLSFEASFRREGRN